jgi:DNA polymerase III subunit gamma/tau
VITALARKYRSRNFAELVGQEHVVKALSHALTTGRLHHAYLLTGTRGVGKTTIARILAKCLNCETGVTATPCGVCSACQSVDQGRFVDLLELDAASNTGVDDMREIIENARYAPTAGRYKVYLIDEVHMLSKNAFNAMLKTLEEPPSHVKFVLATTDPQKIPVTVLSRCLQFNLKQLPPDLISEHLTRILDAENVPHEPQAVQLIARAAAGSMRDAQSITDQAISYGHGTLKAEQVRTMLGVVDTDYVLRIGRALADADGPALLAEAGALYTRGVSFDSVLQELGVLFHDIALKQTVPDAHIAGAWDLGDLTTAFSPETVQVLYQIALTGRRDLPLSPDERAGFTMSLLRMLAFVPAEAQDLAPPPASRPLRALGPRLEVAVAPPAQANTLQATAVEPLPAFEAPSVQAPAAEPYADTAPLSVARAVQDAVPPSIEKPAAPSADSPRDTRNSASVFDGDWPALIARLPLVALTREFARNTALIKAEGSTFYVNLPDDKRALIKHQLKLKDMLTEHFGKPIKLEVALGELNDVTVPSGAAPTLAKQETAARSARQTQAEADFMADPFVQTLVREAGARVQTDTIRPLE